MRKVLAGILVALAIIAVRRCDAPPAPWRCATFNIEHFPRDQRQIDGAFDEIATLGAGIVAVQEITDTEVFARAARTRLGKDWDFISELPPGRDDFVHELGVLYDRRAYTFVAKRIHDGTRLHGRHKATLDVELRDRERDLTVRVLVIHFKSGGDSHSIRARQFAELAKIVAEVKRSGAHVIVLGDFNATGEEDRTELARISAATQTMWATEALPCSAFWERTDSCPRSRLDHILSTVPPVGVRAAGGCATDGCDAQDRCPVYAEHVSDHCPVVATFQAQ